MKKIFVTGTDTDIGKTIVSAGLCMTLPAHYWKPVQAGTKPQTDSDVLAQFIAKECIYPSAYVLQKAASPNQSARQENIYLKKEELISQVFFQKKSLTPCKHLVIEGAGGALVPINNKGENITDLIKAEKASVIIVARSGLGTLNHTFLTLSLLRSKNINILGVIMVGTPHPDNKKDIEQIGKIPVLLELPILKPLTKKALKNHFTKLKPLYKVIKS